MFIPVNEPTISKEAKNNVNEALNTGWISSAGKFVEQFENDFAKVLGVKHAITVTSGTAALHVALLALGVGPEDEVIVPAFTMAATWLAVIYTGAKPVFVDCELETYNIDPEQIEAKITNKTKVIIPVHIYGHPCEMEKINLIATKYNLIIVEDAAEAIGASIKDKLAGSFDKIGCFSFYGNKIITTGEGGMVITDDDILAEKCRKIKDLHHSKKRFIHDGVGYNYRLTNLQAAVGVGELSHLQDYLKKKKWMANYYENSLKNIPGIILPKTKPGVENVFWMYAILIDKDKFGLDRDSLRLKLKEEGIDTRDFFYSPTDQPVLEKYLNKNEKFPNTEYISKNGLYLPSGLALTTEQIEFVCNKIKSISK